MSPSVQGPLREFPLTLVHIFDRAERMFADKHVVTVSGTGRQRLRYGDWAERTRRLGGVLDALGVSDAGVVGTFAWNTARHLELYFAVPCTGRVLHTINVRFTPDQLEHTVNRAGDEVIFVDRALLPLLNLHLDRLPTVKHVVVMGEGAGETPECTAGPAVHDYEELLAGAGRAGFTVDDERRPAVLCHTSGTTGPPKGVRYPHRSIFVHTLGLMAGLGIGEPDRILPAVPMFHINAWGLAHAAVAAGASLVLPGPDPTPGTVADLIETERVTLAAGVPTIWMSVLSELGGRDTASLRTILCGGAAVPAALSEAYRAAIGVPITPAWGMTETGPLGTIQAPAGETEPPSAGRPVLGIEVRITRPDLPGSTDPLPWDGRTPGELQVRGAWVATGYHEDPRTAESFTADGWLRTGDIATIDPRGHLRIVDRAKDVIKSGGEWISSVTLENELMAHPQVAEAAVIAVADPTWGERPLACVVLRPPVEASLALKFALLAFLEERVPRWWLPEDIVFTDRIPKTSVGKFAKHRLRDQLAGRGGKSQ